MNTIEMNYAYLAGMLESELRFLAYDEKFFQMKDHNDRVEYVKGIITRANAKTKEFEASISTR